MYRYRVIDIAEHDPYHEKHALSEGFIPGDVIKSQHPCELIDSENFPGYQEGYIGNRYLYAIKVEAITEHEVEPDPWIPVSERLPEFDEPVLVFCRIYGRFLATYEYIGDFDGQKYGNWRNFKGQLGILPPTHWMPLPEPPQK